MDIEIMEEEAHDLLVTIDREIRRRKFGAVVRLEVHPDTPQRIREFLLSKLEIEEDDLYEERGVLGASALMSVAMMSRADLHDTPFVQNINHALAEAEDPFAVVRQGDVLLHHPYDSFQPVLHYLRRAAEDPAVLAIKMTLYRTGSNSEIVKALIAAAENGKQVAVAIELKARFDEQNNIVWARQLERSGVHVFYGSAGLKTHAKVILVVRQEDAQIRRYVHLSTGNYNVTTSRLYTDLGLFTSDQILGEDVSEVFNALSGFAKVAHYRKLAVAPVTLADTVLRKIAEQAERARAGKPARIYAKMNALVESVGHRRAVRGVAGRSPRGPLRARHLLPAAGRARVCRRTSGCSASSAGSSSTAGPSSSARARRRSCSSRRRTGCRATSTGGWS
jgi:polyphosphate kinase